MKVLEKLDATLHKWLNQKDVCT